MTGHTAGKHWTSQCACVWTGDRENPQMVDPCTAHLVWMQDKARHNRAAPLLLEALKEAEKWTMISRTYAVHREEANKTLEQIRSAIAAATGDSK